MAGLMVALLLVAAAIAAPSSRRRTRRRRTWRTGCPPPAPRTGSARTSWAATSSARVVYGGRITLGMVVAVVVLVAPLGLAVGCVAGYAGGVWDSC